MKWILIVFIYSSANQYAGSAVAEFNDKPSCMAAAAEFKRQLVKTPDVIMCAAKGQEAK